MTDLYVTMGTMMEVAQLEDRLNVEDYRKLQSLFLVGAKTAAHCVDTVRRLLIRLILIQDSSGASRSLARDEFIDLAWSSVGRGSKEEYGLLFDCVVVTQGHRGLILDSDAVKEEGRVEWTALCTFLTLELSEKLKNSRIGSAPRWKPPRTLACPHRDPVRKVKGPGA